MPETIHVTLTESAWRAVRKVAHWAKSKQSDDLLHRFVAAIDKRLAPGDITIEGTPERYTEICNRLTDCGWHLASDYWPLLTAVRRAGNRPDKPLPPVPAADRESAKLALERMQANPNWPGFDLEHVVPETERRLF